MQPFKVTDSTERDIYRLVLEMSGQQKLKQFCSFSKQHNGNFLLFRLILAIHF